MPVPGGTTLWRAEFLANGMRPLHADDDVIGPDGPVRLDPSRGFQGGEFGRRPLAQLGAAGALAIEANGGDVDGAGHGDLSPEYVQDLAVSADGRPCERGPARCRVGSERSRRALPRL